jgi:glycosyltransferase involved in cell wall biosynthesis
VAASLDIIGGQGIQASALAEGLRRDGYTVTFVPVNPSFPRALGQIRRYRYFRTIVNQALYLPSLLALRHVDVVHVFSASYWSFLLGPAPAILAARALGKRVILNYHSGEAEDHLERWGVLVHPWLRMVDRIIVPSRYLQQIFMRCGYRAQVIQNVVDMSRFRFRRRSPIRPRLLCTRNLEPLYRVDVVLRAFALVRDRFREATLTVAGYGSEERRLRRLAASLGERGIRFAGRVEPDRIPLLYDDADIFVNASEIDNQPVSVLEAFAAGLAVVSTAAGDIGNMLHQGKIGCLVPRSDPRAMATAVIALAEDPERAAGMTTAAHEAVQRYSWSRVREQWANAYSGAPR